MTMATRLKSALDVLSSITLIVACCALSWVLFFGKARAPSGGVQQVVHVQGLQLDADKITNALGNARIAIVEFSDFQCPFCAKHAKDTFPVIKRDLVGPGSVKYVALHYPMEEIHGFALNASEASECAAKQGRFWDMHERLFSEPDAMTRADLVRHAEAMKLDVSIFARCLDFHETLDKIRADQAEGRRLGVRGTPAFFIGKVRADGRIELVTRIDGVVTADVFAKQIAEIGQS